MIEQASLEKTILNAFINDEMYTRKVLPFVDPSYFTEQQYKILFATIAKYVNKYNGMPTYDALLIEAEQSSNVGQKDYENTVELVAELRTLDPDVTPSTREWLIEQTEVFCKNRAIYLAAVRTVSIIDGEDKTADRNSLPQIFTDALAVSFDSSVGHDYGDDAEARYDFYNTEEDKIPFDIEALNKITKGGLRRGTLTILMASTGGGKSLAMGHMAAHAYKEGRNVLYLSMEMGEEQVAERVDANLLGLTMDQVRGLSRDVYVSKLKKVKAGTTGRMVIKQFPTASASVNHFRFVLNELKIKRNFVPDIIFVDYINICLSARVKMGSNANSYSIIKSIAEEIRGLAVEYNVPIVSATQTNRGGMGSTDLDLTDVSESVGLTHTADVFLAISASEEMQKLNQMLWQQLKNRYGDLNFMRKFIVGCDRSRMRLYNAEESANDDLLLVEDEPIDEDRAVFDDTEFGGNGFGFQSKPNNKFGKRKFKLE